jgi:hypothetical protein
MTRILTWKRIFVCFVGCGLALNTILHFHLETNSRSHTHDYTYIFRSIQFHRWGIRRTIRSLFWRTWPVPLLSTDRNRISIRMSFRLWSLSRPAEENSPHLAIVVTVAHSWVRSAVLCKVMYLSIWNMSSAIATYRRRYMYHIPTYFWRGGEGNIPRC